MILIPVFGNKQNYFKSCTARIIWWHLSYCILAGWRCVRVCTRCLLSVAGTLWNGLWAFWWHKKDTLFYFTWANYQTPMGSQSQISPPLCPAALSGNWQGKDYGLLQCYQCFNVVYSGQDDFDVSLINQVLDQYAELPNHLLKCLSTNHLAPCGSELYKRLIQQQMRDLCDGSQKSASHTDLDLANRWARRWRPVLHEALTSDITLLQNNSSTHLLPCTFQVFPNAVEHLLASLDPAAPGHLHAWACIMSSYRATTGASPWALQGNSTLQTLQLALGSAEDKVRLAALNFLCCSPKTKDSPTSEEISLMKMFIPQNLNCESSPFRQHFQAGVKRFLVRIRDSCLARVREQKGKKKRDAGHTERTEDVLEKGVGETIDSLF